MVNRLVFGKKCKNKGYLYVFSQVGFALSDRLWKIKITYIPKQMIYSVMASKMSAKVGNLSENRHLVRKLWPIPVYWSLLES